MKTLKARLGSIRSDSGMGIIEVVAALMIFSVIAIGVAYSAVSSLRLSADSKSREVASNLATSEIDRVRALGDPLLVAGNTSVVTIAGVDYTIVRTAGWKTSTGTSSGCGTGNGSLQYRYVDVKVSWPGKLQMTSDVRANTLIAPVTRLNDPSFGTILVSAITAAGTGANGIPVSVTQVTGGAPVTISPTDAEGCAYAFRVTPGTYKVVLDKTDFISSDQKLAPEREVTIVAGGAVSAQFSYDRIAKFDLTYGSNASGQRLPSNLDLTFISTYGTFVNPQGSPGSPVQVKLHPFGSGYTAMAGKYVTPIPAAPPVAAVLGCLSPDPSSWPAGSVGAVSLAAGRQGTTVATSAGGTEPMAIAMGTVTFRYTGANNRYLVAKSATPVAGSGDPGCPATATYRFLSADVDKNNNYTVLLPYGTWSLFTSNNSAGTGTLTPVTSAIIGGLPNYPVATTTKFTLDPRLPL